MNTIQDCLSDARKLIEKPENWTKGAHARDAAGESVDYDSLAALSFCASGALEKVHKDYGSVIWTKAYSALLKSIPNEYLDVADYNDDPETTHEDILRLFDIAINRSGAGNE